ncbi:hypothetical protein SAM23877_p093 (plasmid) [Streptomyces ambofaciens ATCC 23877]|uniref:Uncharacterized protein n=1 Tax=Streptomyces ambofaciens (strain ATCC 23877 / 3486 / DSM 40053 / JCM 4204 / NBRC 12836 / NRRL B-2516) TaxID=278992 RepID=A0A0K2B6U6_STRA7|nr:DUF6221 family protein [Streptomyces ambofaciens]AKZ60802.1 hypothetical protein SAM23877_p093 [Streptomyces ambofaciens ATCC 23877]
MDDPLRFLQDRLNDDETFMRAAIRLRESGAIVTSTEATEGAFALAEVVRNDPDTAAALTLFTGTGTRAPGEAERVLVEVEAKRRMLARHTPHSMGQCTECEAPHWGVLVCNHCQRAWPCPDVRDVAASYTDHHDFPTELRP